MTALASCHRRRFLIRWVMVFGMALGWTIPGMAARPLMHTGNINCLAFAKDGTLASGSDDGCVVLWDIEKRKEQAVLIVDRGPVLSLAFSADGKTLAAGTRDALLTVWDVPGRKLLATVRERTSFSAVSVSPDGQKIASGDSMGTVKLWTQTLGKTPRMFLKHTKGVNTLEFHPEGNLLVSASDDSSWVVWDIQNNNHVEVNGEGEPVKVVRFSTNGKFVVNTWSSRVGGNEIKNPSRLWRVRDPNDYRVDCFALSPSDDLLVWGSKAGPIRVWKIKSENAPVTLDRGSSKGIWALAISPDGRWLAAAQHGREAGLFLWSLDPEKLGKEVHELKRASVLEHDDPVLSVCFAPDGKSLASGCDKGCVRLWEMDLVHRFEEFQEHTSGVHAIAFSPDGKRMATGSRDRTIRIRDLEKGQWVTELKGHTSPVLALAFSPDGKTLASGSPDRTVRLWNLATGKEREQLTMSRPGGVGIAWAPNSQIVATIGASGVLSLWITAKGTQGASWLAHREGADIVLFTPDGQTIVTAGYDGLVAVWDVRTEKLVRNLAAPGR